MIEQEQDRHTGNRMRFEDIDEGNYRIHTGCLELRTGEGFIAAVVVNCLRSGETRRHELYRDTALSCGYRWATPDAALAHALAKGSGAAQRDRNQIAELALALRAP